MRVAHTFTESLFSGRRLDDFVAPSQRSGQFARKLLFRWFIGLSLDDAVCAHRLHQEP
jgi:hypothetical protein